MNRSAPFFAAAAALLAGVSLTSCTAKDATPKAGKDAADSVTVAATDTECTLSATEGKTGAGSVSTELMAVSLFGSFNLMELYARKGESDNRRKKERHCVDLSANA